MTEDEPLLAVAGVGRPNAQLDARDGGPQPPRPPWGVGRAALDDAPAYTQARESFGKPTWKQQSIGNYLADMGTKLTAARQPVLHAAEKSDAGLRCDMEAGMAKLSASETAMEIILDAMRIHGGYGYSTEFDVERYFRDAPLMILGEGPMRSSATSSPHSSCSVAGWIGHDLGLKDPHRGDNGHPAVTAPSARDGGDRTW